MQNKVKNVLTLKLWMLLSPTLLFEILTVSSFKRKALNKRFNLREKKLSQKKEN